MTKAHQTDTDDLVERLEDSKGWPNLGKAAAARIRLDAEVVKAAEALAEAADIKLDVEVRTDDWRHAALDTEAAYRKAILALIPSSVSCANYADQEEKLND